MRSRNAIGAIFAHLVNAGILGDEGQQKWDAKFGDECAGIIDREMARVTCVHEHFVANVDVDRLVEMSGLRYAADVRIRCAQCGKPFRFLGLPLGLDMNGAAVSFDGTEARLAIEPLDEPLPPLDGPTGFSARRRAP